MRLIRSLVLAGMSAVAFVPPASAADYYVKPLKAGPVNGTPLAAITLQAQARESLAAPWRLRTRVKDGEDSVGKWLKAPKMQKARTATTTGSATRSLSEPVKSVPAGVSPVVTETATETPPAETPATEGGQTPAPGTTTGSTTTGSPTTGGTGTQVPTTAPAPNGQVFNGLDALFKSGKLTGGDRVFLMNGYHGPLNPTRQRFTSPVLFTPVPGQVAQVDLILVRDSSNLVFNGLKVWATSATAGTAPLVRSYSNTSDLVFANLDIRSVATAGAYMQWTLTDWTNNKRPGMKLQGNRVTAVGNRLTGVNHGILSEGDSARIENNIVDGFSGDGMRALGDFSVVHGNKVQNCFQIDGNHADGFQSFSRGPNGPGTGTVRDLTVEGNKFFEWVSSATNPLRCRLQGIGMFDGIYDNAMIRNNVISSSAYHGITMAGAQNSSVVNNTVIHAGGVAGTSPWIMISYHKNGTPPRNVIVANNLVTSINRKTVTDPSKQILVTNNVIVTNPAAEFMAAAARDYTLKTTSKAVDAGAPAYAPNVDILGSNRPKGAAPDAGAYEVR